MPKVKAKGKKQKDSSKKQKPKALLQWAFLFLIF
jgi:hypothetical protein